jgi:hypothetical protein
MGAQLPELSDVTGLMPQVPGNLVNYSPADPHASSRRKKPLARPLPLAILLAGAYRFRRAGHPTRSPNHEIAL